MSDKTAVVIRVLKYVYRSADEALEDQARWTNNKVTPNMVMESIAFPIQTVGAKTEPPLPVTPETPPGTFIHNGSGDGISYVFIGHCSDRAVNHDAWFAVREDGDMSNSSSLQPAFYGMGWTEMERPNE